MSLFTTRDSATNRRLLLVAGAGMLLAGLLLGLLDGEDRSSRSTEASRTHAARVHNIMMSNSSPVDADLVAKETSEFAARLAAINSDGAPEPAPVRVEDTEYHLFVGTTAEYLAWFFEAIGYTAEDVIPGQAGTVPPLVALSIPRGWTEDRSVELKKSLFYRLVLPLVLIENREVRQERALVEAFAQKLRNRTPMPAAERQRVQAIAVRYGLMETNHLAPLDQTTIATLLRRVDTIPPSLALAQAAHESGYATSRFATTGNALFGQWDWSKDAMKPEARREELGRYGIRSFDQPIDSVRAYVHNLNTHPSYADFRLLREEQRDGQRGRVIFDSEALAGTLLAYSERGEEYTREIEGMIAGNQLELADGLRLMHSEPIYFD